MTIEGFDALAASVLEALPHDQRGLIAIDGIGGSGKTVFAKRLAGRFPRRQVVLLHADHFFQPSAIRHRRGRHSAEGFWLDAYDYDALASWALVPLLRDGDGRFCASSYDPDGDRVVRPAPQLADDDALVIVEGTFLLRDELTGHWDFSIFLDVPFSEGARRRAQRSVVDRCAPQPPTPALTDRYDGAQRLYFAHCTPWTRASLVVDNTDLRAPRAVDPDMSHARAAHVATGRPE